MAATRVLLATMIMCVLAGGCSSADHSDPNRDVSPTADPSQAAVQNYLTAVNQLCDDLLPKVVAVTKGGSFDIPLKDFLAQLPAHAKLRADFDKQLAQVPVPPGAQDAARAMDAYIRFANDLDAKRLAAAKGGPDRYAAEISAEKTYAATDPRIAARTAAGFHESCDAR
ncbi:MAG: hypothetical protein M3Y44_01190 [Actinomycetota bacterium]|nr:hypothetical protein [Actinomycetota bacterium]